VKVDENARPLKGTSEGLTKGKDLEERNNAASRGKNQAEAG